jgi:hypothetical protein
MRLANKIRFGDTQKRGPALGSPSRAISVAFHTANHTNFEQ